MPICGLPLFSTSSNPSNPRLRKDDRKFIAALEEGPVNNFSQVPKIWNEPKSLFQRQTRRPDFPTLKAAITLNSAVPLRLFRQLWRRQRAKHSERELNARRLLPVVDEALKAPNAIVLTNPSLPDLRQLNLKGIQNYLNEKAYGSQKQSR